MKNVYEDSVAIVTGASSGIGRELALQLAGLSATVVLASRNEERLEEVAALCQEQGSQALVVPTDVADKEACKNLIDRTIATFGRIDHLFNNAGYGITSELIELSDIALFDKLLQVNFNGSMYCTYYALPHLVKTKGRICGISSVAGWFSMAGSSIYNASKHAMRGFFDAIRQEVKPKGVSVTMIYPGYVVTEFLANVQTQEGVERGQQALKLYSEKMMTAEECAKRTLKAAAKRKREVLMTTQANIGIWVKRFFPGLLDRLLAGYRNRREERMKKLLSSDE